MPIYLGIDGGGTKTRCLLGDESRLLGTSVAGPSNVVRVGVERARQALQAVLHHVCEDAKIAPSQITHICVGAAGADREEIGRQIRDILSELTPATVEVVGDTHIALEAAFGTGPGIIAISGTGSIVFGRNDRGETVRAGGWGYAISDEGSAQWIGRRAVWSILRAFDQGVETMLTDLVLKAWNLESLDELVQRANATPPAEFPMLFPVVLHANSDGDGIAGGLLAQAGEELAEQALIVIHRLFPQEAQRRPALDEHARVAMTGSVFRQSGVVRRVFYNQLQARFPGIEILDDIVEPVEGALTRARRQKLAAAT